MNKFLILLDFSLSYNMIFLFPTFHLFLIFSMANFDYNLIIRYLTLGIIQKNLMERMSSIMGAYGRILAQLCTLQTYLVQEGRGKCRYDISSCV